MIQRYKTYKKRFDTWRQTVLESGDYTVLWKNDDESASSTKKLTREELMSFKQCYTTDKNAKFYKARQSLPKFWFVSSLGNVISVWGNPHLLRVGISGDSGNKREQYSMSKVKNSVPSKYHKMSLDPAVLVALVFGDEYPGIATPEAEALLKKNGLGALRLHEKREPGEEENTVIIKKISDVDLHHTNDFKHGETRAELEKNRAYNCDLSNIQFLTRDQHDYFTYYAPRETYNINDHEAIEKSCHPTERDIEELRRHVSKAFGQIGNPGMVIIDPIGKNGGEVREVYFTGDKKNEST